MMTKATALAACIAFALGGLIGTLGATGRFADLADAVGPAPKPVWSEAPWPFPQDQWGKGKAFQCKAADCGTEVNLYIRAKLGFCNCTTGVSDDEELERISDFELMGEKIARLGSGRPIAVAWMKGRSRAYAIENPVRSGRSALSVAFNDRCDAIVATAVVGSSRPGTLEPGVIEFLNGERVRRWAELALGL